MFLEIISNSNYHLDYQPQPTLHPTWPPMPPLTLLLQPLLEVFPFHFTFVHFYHFIFHLCSLLPLNISSLITYIPFYFVFVHFYSFIFLL